MSETYIVVVKETAKSKPLMKEGLNYSGFLEMYGKYHECFSFKAYLREENAFWKEDCIFSEGKMISYKGVKKEDTRNNESTNTTTDNLSAFFDKLNNAHESRKANFGELFFDIIKGEDVSKRKSHLQLVN